MRIWSLNPRYLDRQGLVACWRETLLAQAVLLGRTKGYTSHPQLVRFRAQADPMSAVGGYLHGVLEEARARGYRFDASKIHSSIEPKPIPVTSGQLLLEWEHLSAKLVTRSPEKAQQNHQSLGGLPEYATLTPAAHPLLRVVPGPVEAWEKAEPSRQPGHPAH